MRDCLQAFFEELRRDIREEPTSALMFIAPIALIPTFALLILACFI